MFDIIKRAHSQTGHGGRDKMTKSLNHYANITRESIELYKSLCIECQKKCKRSTTKGVVVRPILSKDFLSRGQVDLIDMQSLSYRNQKWIMVYQDHLTKYCVLRTLTSKRAVEVAIQLIDIFLLFGAPQILQSDNGSEFTAHIISELKLLWTDLLLVHGKPRHPQSQGSVERLNCDVKDILTAWLGDNHSKDWPSGLRFVQFQKNSSYHSGIKQSPYKALFGIEPRIGLRSNTLPLEVTKYMESEEELYAAYSISDPTLQNVDTMMSDPCDNAILAPDITQPSQEPTCDNIGLMQQNIAVQRKRAHDGLVLQSERMVQRSRIEQAACSPGDNVTLPIPLVDRGKGDPRNIKGIILDRDERDLYRIAVRSGILKERYTRNQFDLCTQHLYTYSDVCQEKQVGLREAVHHESTCGGQGFTKCNCTITGKGCKTNRCSCFRAKLLCNSRCHSSLTCKKKLVS